MNNASGGDGIPIELSQILKDDAVKALHSICWQIWKTRQWSQDWKRSVFIPIPKKGNAKDTEAYKQSREKYEWKLVSLRIISNHVKYVIWRFRIRDE